jgi:hypothetical protein
METYDICLDKGGGLRKAKPSKKSEVKEHFQGQKQKLICQDTKFGKVSAKMIESCILTKTAVQHLARSRLNNDCIVQGVLEVVVADLLNVH